MWTKLGQLPSGWNAFSELGSIPRLHGYRFFCLTCGPKHWKMAAVGCDIRGEALLCRGGGQDAGLAYYKETFSHKS